MMAMETSTAMEVEMDAKTERRKALHWGPLRPFERIHGGDGVLVLSGRACREGVARVRVCALVATSEGGPSFHDDLEDADAGDAACAAALLGEDCELDRPPAGFESISILEAGASTELEGGAYVDRWEWRRAPWDGPAAAAAFDPIARMMLGALARVLRASVPFSPERAVVRFTAGRDESAYYSDAFRMESIPILPGEVFLAHAPLCGLSEFGLGPEP